MKIPFTKTFREGIPSFYSGWKYLHLHSIYTDFSRTVQQKSWSGESASRIVWKYTDQMSDCICIDDIHVQGLYTSVIIAKQYLELIKWKRESIQGTDIEKGSLERNLSEISLVFMR